MNYEVIMDHVIITEHTSLSIFGTRIVLSWILFSFIHLTQLIFQSNLSNDVLSASISNTFYLAMA